VYSLIVVGCQSVDGGSGNDTDDIGVVHNVEEAQASEGVNG